MLKLENVTKYYGEQKGIENVSFSIREGKILGMLGSNGSGKTTTFRLLLGLLEKNQGKISINGEEIDRSNKTLFGYLPEERSMLRDLKVKDQIRYLGRLKQVDEMTLERNLDYWLDYLKITQYKDRKIIELSKGNQQKVQLVCALIHDPLITIFDEPLNGLDIENVELFQSVLMKLKKEKKIILISSHQYGTIENLCDSVVYLYKGDILFQGDLLKLKKKQKYRYISFYDDQGDWENEDGVVSVQREGTRITLKMVNQEKAYKLIRLLIKHDISDFRLEMVSLAEIIKEKIHEGTH